MQVKSRKRAAKVDELDRPFDPAILERAKELAHSYRVILEPLANGDFVGSSLEMPNVFADGETAEACFDNVREALTGAVAYLIETGKTPPSPPEEQLRNKQINIRVTEAEQRRLRAAAVANGFSDMSDYIRNKTLHT